MKVRKKKNGSLYEKLTSEKSLEGNLEGVPGNGYLDDGRGDQMGKGCRAAALTITLPDPPRLSASAPAVDSEGYA